MRVITVDADTGKRVYTRKEVADLMGVSTQTIRLWEDAGTIPASVRDDAGYRYWYEEDLAIAVSFGDNKDYYLIEDSFMEDLLKAREALKRVQGIPLESILNGAVGELERGWNKAIDTVREAIQEVYEYWFCVCALSY